MKQKTIAICASTAFYADAIALSYEIERLGHKVILPRAAEKAKRESPDALPDFTGNNPSPDEKADLIRAHFDVITAADAILVINNTKHGVENYIGANVLMEMATAFYLRKEIYVLNDAPQDSPFIEEILGLQPKFLSGDVHVLQSA